MAKPTPTPTPKVSSSAAHETVAAHASKGAVPTPQTDFTFDPLGFLINYPIVVAIALIAVMVGVHFGWKRLVVMYNLKNQALDALQPTIRRLLSIMFKEDTRPVVLDKQQAPVDRFIWLTWKRFWMGLIPAYLVTFLLVGRIPFDIGWYIFILLNAALIYGVLHIRKILRYRHHILMQMFEVAAGEMRYARSAELNPWGYIQVASWTDLYFPATTTVMFPAKYRSEDTRNRQAFEINFNGTVSDQHAWTYTWESSNNRVVCEPVPFIPERAVYPFPDRNPWNIFPLGLASGGEEARWDVATFPHALVAGTTGSGKSVTQRTILLHALQSPDWRVVLIDPKRVELSAYRDHPNVLRVATELDDSLALIEQVEQEMQSRYVRMQEAGGSINHFKSLPSPPPAVLLMIDETFALLSPTGIKSDEGKEQDNMKARIGILIGQIARLGRAAGVHMVLATQRPDAKVLPGEVKANLDARIAQGRMDNIPSLMTLDSDAATRLPTIKGRAIIRTGNDFTQFQAYFLPPEHLPQVLEMSAAIAQGDTSFLDDPEPGEDDIINNTGNKGFSLPKLPKVSFPAWNKFKQWLDKRVAALEAAEKRAAEGFDDKKRSTRGQMPKDAPKVKKAAKAKVEAEAEPAVSQARSEMSIDEIVAQSGMRNVTSGLIPDRPSQAVQPAAPSAYPDYSQHEDDGPGYTDLEDDEDYSGFSDADAEDVDVYSAPVPPQTTAPAARPQSPVAPVDDTDVMDDIEYTEEYLTEETPVPALDIPPLPTAPSRQVTSEPVIAISVADVLRRAAERGVPIPASELLAALKAEAARQSMPAMPAQRTAPERTQQTPPPRQPKPVQEEPAVQPRVDDMRKAAERRPEPARVIPPAPKATLPATAPVQQATPPVAPVSTTPAIVAPELQGSPLSSDDAPWIPPEAANLPAAKGPSPFGARPGTPVAPEEPVAVSDALSEPTPASTTPETLSRPGRPQRPGAAPEAQSPGPAIASENAEAPLPSLPQPPVRPTRPTRPN